MAEPVEIVSEEERESLITWCVLLSKDYSRSHFEGLNNRELLERYKELQPKMS